MRTIPEFGSTLHSQMHEFVVAIPATLLDGSRGSCGVNSLLCSLLHQATSRHEDPSCLLIVFGTIAVGYCQQHACQRNTLCYPIAALTVIGDLQCHWRRLVAVSRVLMATL